MDEVEKELNNMRGQGSRNYVYNRIVSLVQGNISDEVLEDPALDDLWEAAEADKDYQRAAKVIADKVKMKEVMSMDIHPIKQFRKWAYMLSIIENKKGTRLMLLDATRGMWGGMWGTRGLTRCAGTLLLNTFGQSKKLKLLR